MVDRSGRRSAANPLLSVRSASKLFHFFRLALPPMPECYFRLHRPNSKIRENLFPEDRNEAIRLPRFWVEPIAGVDP
ncbi:hypothetical protein Lal_00001802 [Lupinus albus]|nr:hypothetical protein Lal_00001802 [Lupinus albus]